MPNEPKKQDMYGWYDPRHLLQMGIRVGIATIFGEFLDRRELFGDRNSSTVAALDPACNYSVTDAGPRDELWFDFVADSGDGWNSTLAVARLLACRKLNFELKDGEWRGTSKRNKDTTDFIETARGQVLVFGGDEVYATAS